MLKFEMCKRLKEAGFRQNTELGYFQVPDGKRILWTASPGCAEVACPTADDIWQCFTAAQAATLINRWHNEEEPGDSLETALAKYWLEVNG